MPEPARNESGEPVNADGVRICGAEGRMCVCGHHQRDHARLPPANTRRGACTNEECVATGGACGAFDGLACEVSIGLMPNGRCTRHGGQSLSGMAAPGWRGRGMSRVLPERLLDHYHEALNDPDLLSLRTEIALQRALLTDLLDRLREGEHVPRAAFTATAALGRAWRAFNDAYRSGSPDRLAAALTGLDEGVRGVVGAMEPARSEADLRVEVRATTKELERLARSENSRLVDLHNMITAERALALQHASVQALLDVLEANVPDVAVRTKIRREAAGRLAELAGRGATPAAAGNGGGARGGSETAPGGAGRA